MQEVFMLDNISVGNQILLLRKRNGFTQDELAEKLGISAQAISKWENGHTLPETSLLPLLSKLLNTSIDSILLPVLIKEGAIIPFGKYQWRVLKTDGNSAFIIAESVIEQRVFHEEYAAVTWEHCDLRKYLNKQFYDNFEPVDRNRILETRITDFDNQWYGTKCSNPTVDKIFLLSIVEVLQYFGDSGDLKKRKAWYWKEEDTFVLSDGEHCIEYGECINDKYNDARKAIYNKGWDSRWWWLRSQGLHLRHTAASVGYKGELFLCGDDVHRGDGGVRPALWLRL